MAATDPHFRLRIPEDLHNLLTQQAGQNERSINAEIIFRLRMSFNLNVTDEDLLKRRISELSAIFDAAQQRADFALAELSAIRKQFYTTQLEYDNFKLKRKQEEGL